MTDSTEFPFPATPQTARRPRLADATPVGRAAFLSDQRVGRLWLVVRESGYSGRRGDNLPDSLPRFKFPIGKNEEMHSEKGHSRKNRQLVYRLAPAHRNHTFDPAGVLLCWKLSQKLATQPTKSDLKSLISTEKRCLFTDQPAIS